MTGRTRSAVYVIQIARTVAIGSFACRAMEARLPWTAAGCVLHDDGFIKILV